MIKTNPLSVKNIMALAKAIREQYNIPLDQAFPIYDVIEKLHAEGCLEVQILDDDDPYLASNIPAVYNTVDNYIYLKESVLVDYDNNNYRANFTLAHEFFHYLQTKVLDFSFEEVKECKAYEEIDWQANEFAGELLLPDAYLDLDDAYLSSNFKVTLECVLTRKVKKKKRLSKNY